MDAGLKSYSLVGGHSGSHARRRLFPSTIAILGLVLALDLRSMGIANDIVQMAFGLTLGAVAVAVAIAFGLGGREAAGKLAERWLLKLRED